MPENLRLKQKNSTRKIIIESAIKQYALTGLTRTRTIDIAKTAHVSHGTIFSHFPTQEELLTSVIDEIGFRINNRLHELANGKSGVREILEAHIKGLIEFEDFYTRLVIESPLLPENIRYIFIMIQSTISFHLSQAVEKEINTGSIKKLPIHMIFNGWIGLVHYYLTNSDLFSPQESVLIRHGDEILTYYMSLISNNYG